MNKVSCSLPSAPPHTSLGQVPTCVRKPILLGKAFLRLWATQLARTSLTVAKGGL